MGLTPDEVTELLRLVRLTVVPRSEVTLMLPSAVALIDWPTAVVRPAWEMLPLFAWKVRLPEPLVRMFPNWRLPRPAVRLTSPPLVLRLGTVRSVPALKVSDPPAVLMVSPTSGELIGPLTVVKLALTAVPVCR